MKKVININFQGRVIPIEESAYEMLQQYTASLRSYFANEEGRDEIINDIENRIAELFTEQLKKGAACITDEHASRIMDNMGRPQDFDPAPGEQSSTAGTGTYSEPTGGSFISGDEPGPETKKRLYRDEQDKVIGGVASGIANYLNLDPAIIRIIFALLFIFGGSGLLIYIILWIVLPSRSLVTNIRKRLYRDTEDRVIAGVCGGMARYFDINAMIPRIIFAAPFIFGIITSIGRHFFDEGPVFFGGFGGGTFIVAYIILWIVLPEARSSAEKLEMRGERVDMNSIRDTVKGRAQSMGSELSESAQRIGGEVKKAFGTAPAAMGRDIKQAARRSSSGFGNALAILIKAFVYFVGGIIAFALFVGLIALLGTGVGVLPLRDFLLQGSSQNAAAWGTLVLFLGVPIIALLVWFIRRLMGIRTNNKFLGLGLVAAWIIGLFSFLYLLGSMNRSFSSQVGLKEDVAIEQPAGDKLLVKVSPNNYTYYNSWIDLDGILSVDRDTMLLNTIRVQVVRSKDSLYKVHILRTSKGRDRQQAQRLAEKIAFPMSVNDNTLYLPENFAVSKNEKWRNQKVRVVIEVPVGKKIELDERLRDYRYFSFEFGPNRDWSREWDYEWEDNWNSYDDYGREMQMTEEGIKRQRIDSERSDGEEWNEETNDEEPARLKKDSGSRVLPDTTYRYKPNAKTRMQQDKEETSDKTQTVPGKPSVIDSPLTAILRF